MQSVQNHYEEQLLTYMLSLLVMERVTVLFLIASCPSVLLLSPARCTVTACLSDHSFSIALVVLSPLIFSNSLPFHPFCSAASPPLCPTLTDVTTDSLDVSWYPPNIPGDDITDYEVRCAVEHCVHFFHCTILSRHSFCKPPLFRL